MSIKNIVHFYKNEFDEIFKFKYKTYNKNGIKFYKKWKKASGIKRFFHMKKEYMFRNNIDLHKSKMKNN